MLQSTSFFVVFAAPAFVGYSDASLGEPTYLLHLQHTIKAVEKALKFGWLDFDTFGRWRFLF